MSDKLEVESLSDAKIVATLIGGAIYALAQASGKPVYAAWALDRGEEFVVELERRYAGA